MQIAMEEAKQFTPIVVPNDFYDSKCVGEKDITTEFGPSIVLTFEILEGPHKGKKIDAIASKKLNKKTKLYVWLKKMGVDVDSMMVGKLANVELVGKLCRILTTTTERADLTGAKFQQSRVKDIEAKRA